MSVLLGSLIALFLKKHLSEKESMKRLKNSIIRKSKLIKSRTFVLILNSKKSIIKKVTKFALSNRSGQFEKCHELSNNIFKLAQEIERQVGALATFLSKIYM